MNLTGIITFGPILKNIPENRPYLPVVGLIPVMISKEDRSVWTLFVVYRGYKAVSVPGGVVEEGEDHTTALVRETLEEIGIAPLRLYTKDYILTYTHSPKKKRYAVVYMYAGFLGHLEDIRKQLKIKEDEIEEVIFRRIEKSNIEFFRDLCIKGYSIAPSIVKTYIIEREKMLNLIRRVLEGENSLTIN